jgi:hypothetical protein
MIDEVAPDVDKIPTTESELEDLDNAYSKHDLVSRCTRLRESINGITNGITVLNERIINTRNARSAGQLRASVRRAENDLAIQNANFQKLTKLLNKLKN